jgi:sugar/nucleoside kinase (ribokinase family)
MSQILVVGTMAFDEIITPFGESGRILGGSASYISLSSRKIFKGEIGVVSVVGNDFPNSYLELFSNNNIDLSGVQKINDQKSFYWKGKYHNDLNRRDTLVTEVNALKHFEPVVPNKFKKADFLVLGNLHPSIQKSVIEQMEKRPAFIALDTMNYWMDTAWDELMEVISLIDILIVNEEEARQLTKEYSLVKAAKKIQNMGPKYVIIKKGEHGALLFKKNNIFFAPALPLEEVFDPTGAGDTFAGGFIGQLAKTGIIDFDRMKNAVISGSNLASFTVEKFGTKRLENLPEKEIQDRLKDFINLTQFDIELLE